MQGTSQPALGLGLEEQGQELNARVDAWSAAILVMGVALTCVSSLLDDAVSTWVWVCGQHHQRACTETAHVRSLKGRAQLSYSSARCEGPQGRTAAQGYGSLQQALVGLRRWWTDFVVRHGGCCGQMLHLFANRGNVGTAPQLVSWCLLCSRAAL
jgi:hypothetical protein